MVKRQNRVNDPASNAPRDSQRQKGRDTDFTGWPWQQGQTGNQPGDSGMRKMFWKGVFWLAEPLFEKLDERRRLRNENIRRASALKAD